MTTRTVGVRLAEDLRAAAEILERDGWQREALHAAGGGHDITGAIYVATGYHRYDEVGRRWLAHALERSAGRRSQECITWLLRSLPARSLWEFDVHHCLNQATAVDALRKSADNAERLLRTRLDVERLLS